VVNFLTAGSQPIAATIRVMRTTFGSDGDEAIWIVVTPANAAARPPHSAAQPAAGSAGSPAAPMANSMPTLAAVMPA
jgi:hypothetical protein